MVRIWALDALTGAFSGEYAYPLDPPASFRRDYAAGPVAGNDVKVSELAALGDGSLLVLERVTLSTHLYRVTLGEPVRLEFIDPAHRPTLEQVGRGAVPLLAKERVFSSDEQPDLCGDLEGLIVFDDGSLLLSNDSDYGTEGAETQFWRVTPGG